MQDRKRVTNMLIAGTLTVLMLTVFLAFRGNDTAVVETNAALNDEVTNNTLALQAQVEALQAQNAELREAITTLQAREAEYQTQIEAANQTINELSQSGTLASGTDGLSGRPEHSHNH